MDPSFTEFLKLLQSGGNVALIAAAYMLWRAVQSLTRVEVFMSTILDVLLRTTDLKIRAEDLDTLKLIRDRMRSPGDLPK